MRRLLPFQVLALVLCLAASALALAAEAAPAIGAETALRLQPGEQALPGQSAWSPGQRQESGFRISVGADPETPGGFRLEITPDHKIGPAPGQKPAQPNGLRLCLGLTSAARLDLYKTRAVEFRIKASRPVAGILALTSSNTQNRNARDRAFGSFGIGTEWKPLRLPYGTLAPMPGWDEEAKRLGLSPGDHVLRPDSIEDFCLGVEAGRLPQGDAAPLVIRIDGLRFVR
ncbi:MAG TPA: hypothetical protein VN419_04240 [Humidesulfovibrio sp.]|uniref:hypothetical protein n=1 Tax=Humidesulfovibrio sp. TaxID=2910988 RepID=UPI002BA4C2DE|nr:hypothetical protein [Humidesulfovibrio sp.]HWR03210.1 hypothetical protein [Humidesulfovibrio sp.]